MALTGLLELSAPSPASVAAKGREECIVGNRRAMFERPVWLVCHQEWISGLLAVEGLVLQGDVIDRLGLCSPQWPPPPRCVMRLQGRKTWKMTPATLLDGHAI